jgi:hypothetical protein
MRKVLPFVLSTISILPVLPSNFVNSTVGHEITPSDFMRDDLVILDRDATASPPINQMYRFNLHLRHPLLIALAHDVERAQDGEHNRRI